MEERGRREREREREREHKHVANRFLPSCWQGFYVEAAGFYESTLNFQPEFKPAADRLMTVRCLMLMAKNQHLKDRDKKQTIAANR